MALNVTKNVHIRKDVEGRVRHIRHPQQLYRAEQAGLTAASTKTLAAAYVHDVAKLFDFDAKMLARLNEPVGQDKTRDSSLLQFETEKSIQDSVVIGYRQTYNGLPVWEAGLAVHLQRATLGVTSANSTVHYDIRLERPKGAEKTGLARLDADALDSLFEMKGTKKRRDQPTINRRGRLIYRYRAALRIDPEIGHKHDDGLSAPPPTLPLPPVPDVIREGAHFEVIEVLFTLRVADIGPINWRVFIEPVTGAVLYLRALVSSAFGNVFVKDPLTKTGNAVITPASPATTLDPITDLVTLPGLTPPAVAGNPQALLGEYVELVDTSAPPILPPTAALPAGNFSYSAVTDNFSAANAYYHCDWLFRLVDGMGIDVATYFDGTTFPVPVDHRGLGAVVNAQAPGNATGDGSGGFLFALAMAGQPVGIAADRRVVLHEFGHALLWDHVSSPNFGFAHSAGDSLAAILCDPGSLVPDRFLTFPWITTSTPGIDRRHDRAVGAGWAWDGANDTGGYNSEQILATTHFRIYGATGGDDTRIEVKEFAARYLSYLIIKAIGLLTPATNAANADEWTTALMDADLTNLDFEGHPGGAFHKVVRWGFEKQGLYQPAGAPTPVTTEGAPPEVDVYINDGRNGEYQYQPNFWNTQDIWCRNAADGGLAHQTPIVSVPNYLYVRVKNRGSQTAQNVVVKAYNCVPAAGLVWPDDWTPMTTAQLSAPDIASGGEVVVGPFEWTPQVIGHECVLCSVSADGDLSNADTVNGSVPHWRLVPFDNNIAQRNLAPVAGGGGGLQLSRSFLRRRFTLRNPFPRIAAVEVEITLPAFLARRNWKLQLATGGGRFTLGPRASREVELVMTPGGEFSADEVRAAGNPMIDVMVIVGGYRVGGMSYHVDPNLKAPPTERPTGRGGRECAEIAGKLLDCLCLPGHEVHNVRIRRITVDIDLKDDCN